MLRLLFLVYCFALNLDFSTSLNGEAVKSGSPPRDVQARALSYTTVVVDWERPEQPLGQISGYRVYYTSNPSLEIQFWDYLDVDDSQLITISDLQRETIYTIRVSATIVSRGEGPLSPPVQVKTKQGVPNQPLGLQATAQGPHSIKLTWKKPPNVGETVVGYNVYWNDTFENNQGKQFIPESDTYIIENLYPDTLYYIWIAALSNVGEGAATPPIAVKTEIFGKVTTLSSNLDDEWTSNSSKVLAGTSIGEEANSQPIMHSTTSEETVPGEPRDVKAVPINSTSIRVEWNPPSNIDQHGVRRGYQIYVHEMSSGNREEFLNDPIKFDVLDPNAKEFNVTSLQPDTLYNIQVAAITRKGDGTRSKSFKVRTLGGVPTKPDILIRLMSDEPQMTIEVQWTRPKHTYGSLLGYRLKYGRATDNNLEEIEINPQEQSKIIKDLDRGVKYIFRLAGKSSMGWGQEAVAYIETPEGPPGAPPQNISYRLQTPTTVVITWDPPLPEYRNGRITSYGIHFQKPVDTSPEERFTNDTRIVFSSLTENAEYTCKIRAFTSKGPGPWSNRIQIQTPGDVPPAPTNVQAMATTEKSVEVWWDQMPFFADILGYTVLYAQTTAVEDLDSWLNKTVVLTWSVELTGLKPQTMYAIRVAAYTSEGLGRLSELITVRTTPFDVPLSLRAYTVTTHTMSLSWRQPTKLNPIGYKITYEAHKEFYDSLSMLKTLPIPPQQIDANASTTQITIDNLMPFTSYQVNVTAIPADKSYRPPARKTVTTAMAAPKPMVKPDFLSVKNGEINVILPQASEEYGPISHYFLVVVPSQFATKENTDLYTIEELTETPVEKLGPYIAAKFPRRSVPNQFPLGDGKKYSGFRNRKLKPNVYYKIFVRAIVDAPHKNLFTSSPFSLALNPSAPPDSTYKPSPRTPSAGPNIAQMSPSMDGSRLLGIVAIIMISLILIIITVVLIYINRRRQMLKAANMDTTLKLLMNTVDPRDNISHPSDPVEMRRITYQTAGMMNHPPIPVTELANHIERLKADENLLFSQEYESIEPGQQFTWENSNMEINKPKNRYANVIAYDHSRVVLQTLDGIPGSDYINANYCDGYRKQNAYIATQGPLPDTIGDFWRMVWEQRSYSVVMMTKLEERTRVKCDQYWPTRGTENYGVMQVSLTNTEELAYYCIRTFTLQRYGYMESREVKQFQFTAWPDHGVPDHPTPFLMFLRRIKSINPPEAGPMIIHCSAGVGRSGCFIVIDSMLDRLKYENTVDIYGHVTVLRAQRNYMVQTEDQYIFINDAVLEAVIAGNTEVSIRNLYNHVQMLLQVVPGDSITGMELEFKKIASMRTPMSKFTSANLPCNKFKNRLMNILPYESNRVYLQPLRAVEGSDYINASFIDGYRYRSAYIATQGPIPETTEDFWRMLWEHNSNIIVMLTKVKEMGRDKCHHYWPSERSQRYLYFVVDPITEYNMPQYILREFKVTDARDGQSRTIRQFHFVEWPEQGVPKSGEGFIDFITQVHKTKEQFGQEGPITVHCSAGVGRTGVFISLSIVLERIQNEGVIDLFQTVRTLRTLRPGMVQTEDQYQFCYRAALEYISTFDYAT